MSTPSYDFLDTAPVVPVIAIESLEHAVPLAQALVSGGICNLEITLRTACAIEAIQMISNEVRGAHVGAGTVCNAEQFDAVVEAGAKFVVSPGQSDLLFERSLLTDIPLLPGAVTITAGQSNFFNFSILGSIDFISSSFSKIATASL